MVALKSKAPIWVRMYRELVRILSPMFYEEIPVYQTVLMAAKAKYIWSRIKRNTSTITNANMIFLFFSNTIAEMVNVNLKMKFLFEEYRTYSFSKKIQLLNFYEEFDHLTKC